MKLEPVFYAPPENITDDSALLDATESHHLTKVMRLKKSDLVVLVDGLGMAYRCEMDKVASKQVSLRIHSSHRNWGEPAVRVTLAAGISTGVKFDTVVQKGTELGIKRFVPLHTSRATVALTDPKRVQSRVKRLEKVALAAMKQCRRAYRPDIATPTNLTGFLDETDQDSVNLILHPGRGAVAFSELELPSDTRRVSLMVGPESGFSDDEVLQAQTAGFKMITLGSRILRTETAGPTIAAMVMNALGEFS